MAVTAGGTPYVESTDLVANYPATSLSLANKVDTKVDYALPVNAQTGTTYTFVLADGLRLTTASNAAPSTYTVPPQSSVVWLDNSVIRLVNYGAGVVTVAGGSGVTVTNAATTLAQFESVALIRTGSDAWTLVPFSGGVSNADFSDAATGTYSSGGFDYKYITYTASGTLTVTTAGFADVLIVGGGAGGYREASASAAAGGGAAGGHLLLTNLYVPSGTTTVTIGAGGAGGLGNFIGLAGVTSRFGENYVQGGGAGGGPAGNTGAGYLGGSGGGGGYGAATTLGGTGTPGLGNNGGTGTNASSTATSAGGGGGGAGSVGTAGATNTGGAGGSGTSTDLDNVATLRAGGGGGGASSTVGAGGTGGGGSGGKTGVAAGNGTAATGGGGGGMSGTSTAGNGGSGTILVRVKV
jgi:hypothetical protein